jgi:hypothetical protein
MLGLDLPSTGFPWWPRASCRAVAPFPLDARESGPGGSGERRKVIGAEAWPAAAELAGSAR